MVSILESHLISGHFFPAGYRAAEVILPVAMESSFDLPDPRSIYHGVDPIPIDLYNFPLKNIPDLFNGFYIHSDYKTQRKFDHFWESCDVYDAREKGYILHALMIATVGHQYNLVEKKRLRKADNSPYIFHPLEIAERFIREGFDWITVVSSLLHDVPEDVHLGPGLSGREAWLEIIRREFRDTGKGDLIAEIVDGVTEKKVPEEQRKTLRNTSIYRMIRAFIVRGGVKGNKLKGQYDSYPDRETIDEVVFNLLTTFDAAFISPDHARIILLKIADIWHNFQTAEYVKTVKILRGKIAAGLAEWMGWYQIRSDLIEALAEVADTTRPYAPSADIGQKYKPRDKDKRIGDYLTDSKVAISELLEGRGVSPHSVNYQITWPITDSYDDLERWKGSTLPHPQVIVEMDRESINKFDVNTQTTEGRKLNFGQQLINSKVSGKKSWVRFKRMYERFSSVLAARLGRKRIDYMLKIGTFPGILVRFESSEPKVIDFFQREREKQINWQDIPEAGIFNNLLLDRPEEWEIHLGALISFLYDPNLSLILKDVEVAGVIHKGRLIFMDSRTKFTDLYNLLGMPIKEIITGVGGEIDSAVRIRDRWGEKMVRSKYSLRSGYAQTSIRDFMNRIIEIIS